MVVPTGTATRWISIEPTGAVWACPRDEIRSGSDLLAEALRIEGFARSLGPALSIADTAELSLGWIGWLDGDDYPTVCLDDGLSATGDELEDVTPCVFARVDVLLY